MNKDTTRIALLSSCLIMLLLGWWVYYLLTDGSLTPEELVAIALDPSVDEDLRVDASLKLKNYDQVDYALLKRLFDESKSEEVKVGAMLAMGKYRHWEAVPMLLVVVGDDNVRLAEQAIVALELVIPDRYTRLSGKDAEEDAAKRHELVKQIKEELPVAYSVYRREQTARRLGKENSKVTQEEIDQEFPPEEIPEYLRMPSKNYSARCSTIWKISRCHQLGRNGFD